VGPAKQLYFFASLRRITEIIRTGISPFAPAILEMVNLKENMSGD
jgi:hypothetical protein